MTGPPVVLSLLRTLKMGGSERLAVNLAAHILRRRTFRPVICAWRCGGALEETSRRAGVPTRVLNLPRRRIWAAPMMALDLWRVHRAVTEAALTERAELLHCRLPDGPPVALSVARRLGLPVLVHVESHNLLPEHLAPGTLEHRFWRLLVHWSLRRASLIVACSGSVRERVIREVVVPPDKVVVVTNGVAMPPPRDPRVRARVRDELGIAPAQSALICVGRLTANKGQHRLLEMLPQLLSRHGGAKLLLVGEGPDRSSLERQARQSCPDGSVIFTGSTDRVAELLVASDVFVTASVYEGVSLALLEAMAAGLPAIAVASPGNNEVLADGAGILLELATPAALAQAVCRLIDDPAYFASLAAAGRRRVAERYFMERTVAGFESFYRSLLVGGSHRHRAQ